MNTSLKKNHLKILIIITPLLFLLLAINRDITAQITLLNKNSDNPTLLYKGNPLFKFGPLPETAIFSVKWGTSGFPHKEWLDWMVQNHLGYGRVYPESGLTIGGETDTEIQPDNKNRLFPYKIDHWNEGRPVFDITEFNSQYWNNFSKVIAECAERDIILQMQLYQRVYFSSAGSWHGNFYNPVNNMNKFTFPERKGGYGLFTAMMKDPVWREIHTKWVKQILAGIGKNGNVIIDLMNEGSFQDAGLTEEWVEYTLDLIETWENETGVTLLKGFDFDHIYKKKDPNLEYILAHPRLDLLISEGSEGHVVPELVAGNRVPQKESLAIEYRERYKKPVISTNSPAYSITEDPLKLNLYQWYSMMVKVQGAGVYAKVFPLDFSASAVKEYTGYAKILADFFSSIRDYGKLDLASGLIREAPCKYRLALASENEMVLYLHSGELHQKMITGKRLVIENNDFSVQKNDKATIVHPSTGEAVVSKIKTRNKKLIINLPPFQNDIAVHIVK
jgi:hypothetical protein